MDNWIAICNEADVPSSAGLAVQIQRPNRAALGVALFRTRQGFFALHDQCPHRGGQLSGGEVDGEHVYCPMHGWKIDLRSGAAVKPGRGCAVTFSVQVQRGQVLLNQSEIEAV